LGAQEYRNLQRSFSTAPPGALPRRPQAGRKTAAAAGATWLVLRHEAQRTEAEAQQLAQLHAQSAEVAEAIDLAQDFTTLVRQRQPA